MCYILYDLYLSVTFAVNVTILGVKNVYNPSLDSLQMYELVAYFIFKLYDKATKHFNYRADWAVQFVKAIKRFEVS